jgi:hypothetical protein
MAERFVFGFVASSNALPDLVGSRLDAGELLAGVSAEFVEMFDDEFRGRLSLTDCAAEVLAGDLNEEHAYPYARLVEPLLTVVAEPLGMIHMALTYYLPNDSFGRWNPVLSAVGLSRLASLWGTANAFPWPGGRTPHWPCVTRLSPTSLAEVTAELAGDWRARLNLVPDSLLSEGADPGLAAETRAELTGGLAVLAEWVERAAAPWTSQRRGVSPVDNSLILVMDGSQ